MKKANVPDDYQINHVRHGCYEVIKIDRSLEFIRYVYLTNFRNMKAAKKFIEQHMIGAVKIDTVTRIPDPDFK
tara:strand:+ start:1713 stop:1931 length:219 start_codon:yes stop_codon:yes gene_type:complete